MMSRAEKHERPIFAMLGASSSITRLCMALATIEQEWRRIVGDSLARRSSPSSYQDGVLHIAVDSQAVLHDMNFKKNAIAREIRTKVLLNVESVKIEIGSVRPPSLPSVATRGAPLKKISLDEERLCACRDEILSAYAEMDPELAKSIARAKMLCEADSNFSQ